MTIAPWRTPLQRALHLNRSLPYSRYFQLATTKPDGRPANRTVVFRGFLENTNQLQIVTDNRSEKINQIECQPWAEACWYFTKTREQFRLAGKLTLIKETETDNSLLAARQKAWENLSDSARSQFAWPTPKQNREPEEAFSVSNLEPTQVLSTFCLLLLEPEVVDHLELKGEPQNRSLYSQNMEHNWIIESVNP